MTLQAEYERLCCVPSDIHEHLPTLYELATTRRAQHVIELGTRGGVSTIAWLHALDLTGGRLTSVDLDPGPDISHPRWTFIQGDDTDPELFARLDPADIVFIDTSHLYEHTLTELRMYRWLVRPGGVIVCHDTELPRPEEAPPRPLYPVKKAITEFCADEGFSWENRPNCWGLGIIEVN